MRWLAVIVCLSGCRVGIRDHLEIPARTSNVATLALFADDDAVRRQLRDGLQRDPHIRLLEDDVSPPDHCRWSRTHGAELYTVASGDKLTTYESETCTIVPNANSFAALAERVRETSGHLPEALTVDEEARLVGDRIDGFYAVYRHGKYRGELKRAGEYVTPLYWPMELELGDTLVERGQRRFIEVGVDFVAALWTERSLYQEAAGVGAHVRYYSLDGGLQFGVQADALAPLMYGDNVILVTGEVGWGMRVSPGLLVALNAGVGRANLFEISDVDTPSYEAWALLPSVRVQTFVTTRVHAALDLGLAIFNYGGHPDDYGELIPTRARAPISRITVGIDL